MEEMLGVKKRAGFFFVLGTGIYRPRIRYGLKQDPRQGEFGSMQHSQMRKEFMQLLVRRRPLGTSRS